MPQKLSLSLEVHDTTGSLQWHIEPPGDIYRLGDRWIYETAHLPGTKSQIKVHVHSVHGDGTHLFVKDIILNGVALQGLNMWSNHKISGVDGHSASHGYMNRPGILTINIRQNALVNNYISYFQSMCCKNKSPDTT